jgi:hypothetical protein
LGEREREKKKPRNDICNTIRQLYSRQPVNPLFQEIFLKVKCKKVTKLLFLTQHVLSNPLFLMLLPVTYYRN